VAESFTQVIEVALRSVTDPSLRALLEDLRDLGTQGELTDDQLSGVTSAVEELNQQAAAANGLQASISALEQYRAEQERIAQAVDKSALRIKLAAEQEAAAAQALDESKAALEALRAERDRYNASEEKTTEGTRQFADSLKEAQAAQKAAQTEYSNASATLRQATTEYEKAVTAQDKLNAGIGKSEDAIKAAGLSVEDLAGAQAELQKRLTQTGASTEALARNIRESVAANQQAAAAARQNAAAQQALADANATLGRRSFAEVRAEIEKVRQAYETLRASGTLTGRELAQAQSLTIERTRQLRSEYGSLGASLQQVQGSLIAAGASLFTATRLLSNAASAASQFQRSLAAISTIAPQADLQALGDSVRELTREFGGDASRNAAALYEIIAAGVEDTTQALEILRVANQLAIGGLADTETAASGLVATLNAYGLAAEEATRVSDAFFVAAAAGNTTIEELSNSIGGVAPLAASVGVSIEQLTSAVGALTAGGLDTGQAFTQIQSALTAVVKPTAEAQKAAEALGIQFNVAALRSQGLQQFLQGVSEAAQGNETTLATLFGRVEGLQGVLALTGNQADAFAKALADMEQGAGRTAEAFAKLQDTPEGRLRIFTASVRDLQLSFGQAVTALTPLLDGLTSAINLFNELPSSVRTGIAGVTALAAVIAPLAIAIAQSRAALVLLLGSLKAIGPAAAGAGAGVGVFTTAANTATAASGRLTASLGLLNRALGVLAVAAAAGSFGKDVLGPALDDIRLAATESGKGVARLAEEIQAAGAAGAQQAGQFRNFADVQVKSAEAAAQLGDAQREAYRTALEGLEQYLKGRGRELVAIKQRGEATDREIKELDETKKRLAEVRQSFVDLDRAGLGAADSIAAVSEAADSAPVTKLADEIRRAAREGKGLEEAVAGAFDGIDFENEAGRLGQVALAFDEVSRTAGVAGQQIRDTIAKEIAGLSGRELLRFQQAAEFAFDNVGKSGRAAGNSLAQVFELASRRLGVSLEAAGVQISEEGGNIIATFQTLAQSGLTNANVIEQGFKSALARVSTSAEVKALGDALATSFAQGKISAQQYDQALQLIQKRQQEIKNEALGIEPPAPPPPEVAKGYQAIATAAESAAGEAEGLGQATEQATQQSTGALDAYIRALINTQREFAEFASSNDKALEIFNRRFEAAAARAQNLTQAYDALNSTAAGLRQELATQQAIALQTAAGLDRIAGAADLAQFALADVGAGLAVGLEATQAEAEGLLQAIEDVRNGAENAREDLQLLDDATLDKLQQAAQRAADRVRSIGEEAANASQQLAELERRLQDDADRAAGREEDIRRRQLQDQLDEIDELAAATNGADTERAARLRRLAEEAFQRDLQLIRAREREQTDSDDRVRDRRQQNEQSSGSGSSAGRGDSSRATPARPAASTPTPPPIVITFNGPTLGTPEDLARELTRQIDRLQRTGFNPRIGR
jgi:TP901 family phage tail tape measure protein